MTAKFIGEHTMNAGATEDLEEILQRRLGNRIRHLRVLLQDGGVVLHGLTSTYHAKQLAQHWAMELFQLPIIANEIEVR